MSVQRIRQLKLYQKLQKDLNYRQKLQEKIRQISSKNPSVQSFKITRKINNNKKYLQQQERNAEIERQNRILLQKIQSNATKNHYHKKSTSKNRSSKTLNKHQSIIPQTRQRKRYNRSQNKINYLNQQSRISFQQNEQLLRPKNKRKITTQFTQQVVSIFNSRILQSKINSNQIILFQGIAQIDTIRFKVKISIKNKIYCLSGKNKHTDILLKMQVEEYRKFHKQVLMGNPSNIFQYLIIDKGQIKFRTAEEHPITYHNENKQRIYQIQQQDQQSEQLYKKYKQIKKKSHYRKNSGQFENISINQPKNYEYNHYNDHQKSGKNQKRQNNNTSSGKFVYNKYSNINEQQNNNEKMQRQHNNIYYNHANHRNDERKNKSRQKTQIAAYDNGSKSTEKLRKKQNISLNSNPNIKRKADHYEKHRTLEEYINDNNHYYKDPLKSGDSTEVEVKNIKNRYKLPYL